MYQQAKVGVSGRIVQQTMWEGRKDRQAGVLWKCVWHWWLKVVLAVFGIGFLLFTRHLVLSVTEMYDLISYHFSLGCMHFWKLVAFYDCTCGTNGLSLQC